MSFQTSRQRTPVEPAYRVETVEEFLNRGGTIQRCPAKTATGVPSSMMAYVDGLALPLANSPAEYVPSFVRDLSTYDAAQTERTTPVDDGSAAQWTEYEQSSIPSAMRPAYERNASLMLGDE